MGLSKEDILQRLQPYGVECHEHDAVMTCETQAAALSSVPGQVTKNLFLRDKKRRQYLITALPDTKVDIKVLSSRLGLGKGGVSWGSPELLQEALQVEPGCVTPLALANDTTKHCVLLLDQNIKALGEAGKIFVHPIVNTASVAIAVPQLEAFLRSIGREPVYVDLEADPKIDKDNPPDLKQYADAVEPPPKVEGQEDQPAAAAANSTKTTAVAAAAGGTGAVAAAGSSSSSKKSSSKAPKAAKGAAAAAPSRRGVGHPAATLNAAAAATPAEARR